VAVTTSVPTEHTQPMQPVQQNKRQESLACKVITHVSIEREMEALETLMQGLALSDKQRDLVALEIAGTPTELMWIIRSASEQALDHAKRQISARYPQVLFERLLIPLDDGAQPAELDDPFYLKRVQALTSKGKVVRRYGESISALELGAGGESYLPMREWDQKAMQKAGTDPLLGVLASIDRLPEGMRAIAQIALVPARATWADKSGSRKAVEHPLEQEKETRRAEMYAGREGKISTPTLVGLSLLLVMVLVGRALHVRIPVWLLQAFGAVLHGHWPQLSGHEELQFYGGAAVLCLVLFLLYVLFDQVRKRFFKRTKVYDQRLVSQQVGQVAYRVRLRLYVIGPGPKRRLIASCLGEITHLRNRVVRCWKGRVKSLRRKRNRLWGWLRGVVSHPEQIPGAVAYAARGAGRLGGRCKARGKRACDTVWMYVSHPRRIPRAVKSVPSRLLRWVFRMALGEEAEVLLCTMWSDMKQEWSGRKANAAERSAVLKRMVAAYRQFHQGSGGYFVPRQLSRATAVRLVARKRRWKGTLPGWTAGVTSSRHMAGVKVLAVIWHLLQVHDLSHVGRVATRSARTLPIPLEVARLAQGTPVIGHARHGEYKVPFAFTEEWLRLHGLVLGKSGEGKSTYLLHIMQAAMQQQGGAIFFDIPGTSTQEILERVPHQRKDDVVLIDLADPNYSVGLNPLDVTLGRGRDKTIADTLEILSKIWMRSWGSRMENAFEFALRLAWEFNLWLVDDDEQFGREKQLTLLDILPLYTNQSYCNRLLDVIKDPYVRRWWFEFYFPLPLFMKRDIINPVATKIAKFESEIARRIVGQPVTKINFAELIRQKKIIIIRLAKGTVGADAAPLLGATLLGLLTVCLEEQGILAENERALFPILIDEFQVLEGVDWSMLAQLRKYGATFFLATQSLEYLQKLDAVLLPTVLANVRQIYSFNISAQDAWTIHREMGVEPEDLINLDSHMCYVKLKTGVHRRPTFSLEVDLPSVGDAAQAAALAQAIRNASQLTYGEEIGKVEQKLREASSLNLSGGRSAGITTIDATADALLFEPDSSEVSAPASTRAVGKQSAKERPPRERGRGAKGDKSVEQTRRDQKPQMATTPQGDARSVPAIFVVGHVGEDGGTDDELPGHPDEGEV
jgi:hypothetical protein